MIPIARSPSADSARPLRTSRALSRVTPPPATTPSAIAALVAFSASSTLALVSLTSVSVAAPILSTATPPVSLPTLFSIFSLSHLLVDSLACPRSSSALSSVAFLSPPPPTTVVLFLATMMRSALPRLVGPCALRSAPWSLNRGLAPVSTAMSSSCSEISSPNPGALTATAFTTLLTTFSTSVASASPSMSLATISRGLFCWTLASSVGSRSCAELIVWSVRRISGLSWTASLFSLSVIM